MTIVLDTHIFVRWFDAPRQLSRLQLRALKGIGPEKPAFIADITLWEVATLVSLGRLRPRVPLREWLETALERPHLWVQPITAAVAAEVAALGDDLHRDPADRLIVATARVRNLTLRAKDDLILKYGNVKSLW